MIPESKLKEQCTPDIIKKMVELAEGFDIGYSEIHRCDCVKYKWEVYDLLNFSKLDIVFPLLIHRAVEGWNKKEESILKEIIVYNDSVKLIEYKESREGGFDPFAIVMKKFENYQPQSLTQAECAILHCLLDIFQKEVK